MNGRWAETLLLLYAKALRLFARSGISQKVERVAIFSALGPGLRAGDHVAASIAFVLVARRFPGAEIHLVTTAFQADRFRDLYLRHMPIDRLIVCADSASARWRDRISLWRTIRGMRFDACVQDSRDTRLSPFFAHLCGIGMRFGLQRGLATDAFINQRRVALAGDWGAMTLLDMAEAYAEALSFDPPLAREQITPHFRLAPLEEPLAFSSRRAIVVVHPGGSRDWNRRWPQAHYAALCEQLIRRCGAQVLIVGGDDERDDAEVIIRYVRGRCPEADMRHACGGDLNRLAHHVARADLVVGNDSSVMHIAAGLDVPAVIVFGPTICTTWDAYRRQTSLTLGMECWRHRPTLRQDVIVGCGHGCPVAYDSAAPRYPHCMTHLSVSMVFDRCESILAERGFRDEVEASTGGVAGEVACVDSL